MLSTLLALSLLTPQGDQQSLSSSVRELPALGGALRDERILDRATGRILRRTVDAATGQAVDGDALLVAEAAARDRIHEKISPELRWRLQAETELKVVFWMKRDAAHPDLRGILDAAIVRGASPEDARRETLAAAAVHAARLTAPFVAAATAGGHEVTYVDSYVPIVFVQMNSGAVAALAARPDVDQVYYAFPTFMPEEGLAPAAPPNEWASPSARTDHVHRKGITGAGVKVMVNDVGNVVSTNPYLPPLVLGDTSGAQSHATAVAGMISSNHAQQTGAAPGLVQLYSHGAYGDQGAPIAWSWGMQQGISFGNCSWWNGSRGAIVFLDRYFDYIIRNFAVMLFKSCGNQGNGQPITTPGNGFNMIASGCADDRDTHDWDDDVLASFSSTANPQPSDHEKPEITAHGSGITSTSTSSPWIRSAGSGTSYASPVTCGSAALLAETDPALQAKPEVVKAALMAGAWNNIHGAAVLSDWDGAGGIDAAASQAAVAGAQYVSTTLTPSSFQGGIWSTPIRLDAGDETRIVALWFSEADSSYSTDVLMMDLDMTVEDPGGVVVASSASAKNPFEIVGFVPPATGTYTVKLHQQRFQGTSEPLAVAWNTSQNAATDVVTITGNPRLGATLTFEFFDRYHPGATYLSVLSLSPYPATWVLPPQKLIPLGFDGLSEATLVYLPGFVGTLSAAGKATTQLTIPQAPGLIGRKFFSAMATLEAGRPEAEEISGVTSFTISP